jgi:hypothetical protein
MERWEELMLRITDEFLERKLPSLSVETIRTLTKDLFSNQYDLSKALRYLVKSGKLEVVANRFRPSEAEKLKEDLTYNPFKKNERISEDGIIRILEIFGRGKPAKIAEWYLSIIGPANVETITRKVRDMATDGKLIRNDDDIYSLTKDVEKTIVLTNFVAS